LDIKPSGCGATSQGCEVAPQPDNESTRQVESAASAIKQWRHLTQPGYSGAT